MIRSFGPEEVMFIILAARWTLVLSVIAFAGGAIGGLILAMARISSNKIVSRASMVFIRFFQLRMSQCFRFFYCVGGLWLRW